MRQCCFDLPCHIMNTNYLRPLQNLPTCGARSIAPRSLRDFCAEQCSALRSNRAFCRGLYLPKNKKCSGFTLIELLVILGIIAILTAMLLPASARTKSKAMQATCMENEKQLGYAFIMYAGANNDKLVQNNKGNVAGNWVRGYMSPALSPTDCTNPVPITQGTLYPYVNNVSVYHCPADVLPDTRVTPPNTTRVRTYSINCYMNSDNDMYGTHGPMQPGIYFMNRKSTDIKHPMPVSAIVFVEEVQWTIDDGQFAECPSGLPGHIEWDQWYNVPANLHPGANFAFADDHVEYRKWVDDSTLALQTQPTTGAPYPDTSTDHADLRWVQDGMATPSK